MHPSSLLLLPLLLSLTLPLLTAATPPPSFCKCICFDNSTIIALNPPKPNQPSPPPLPRHLLRSDSDSETPPKPSSSSGGGHGVGHKLTCADCNRAFCLSYNLPICRDAREEDVFTTCFQRDSVKDEVVVLIFLCATAGLLGWAGLRPWVEKVRSRAGMGTADGGGRRQQGSSTRGQGGYVPVVGREAGGVRGQDRGGMGDT